MRTLVRAVARAITIGLVGLACVAAAAQDKDKPAPAALTVRPNDQAAMRSAAQEAVRINGLARINGLPYDQPSAYDTFRDYLRDSYGLPALVRTLVRSVYAEGRDKPAAWSEDFEGFGERFGSAAGTNIINGNVRYAMELTFHEDLRYLPCIHCGKKAKIMNALLAEVTARHSDTGHRFFSLTPTVADFSGPIVAHSTWYPGGVDPLAGVVAARVVFATRIGAHLFQEFVWVHYHPGLRPQN